uniref:Uncharacterized protein n=1 Tax=Rhizophora mucronata TaxID=61149 RepID=A0A2P2J7X4_RHIMU
MKNQEPDYEHSGEFFVEVNLHQLQKQNH